MTSTIFFEVEERLCFYSFYRICTEINDMSTINTTLQHYSSFCLRLSERVDQAIGIYHHKLNDGNLTIKCHASTALLDIKLFWSDLHYQKFNFLSSRQVVNK